MRRALAHPPRSWPASASACIALPARARTPTRASTGSQFDNAFGLIQGGDLKVAGVRAGKITDIKLDKRTKHALIGFKIDKNGFGSLRSDAFCESRPQSLIGEYFVDCQPGTAKQELKPGAVDPGQPHGVDGRARPRQRHPAPPLPRAPEPHHRLARRRRGGQRREPQRRHPPRQPGAARDRQGARHARRAEPGSSADLDRQRRQGRRRPGRQPQGRRALRQPRPRTPRRPRPSAARDIAAGFRELPGFLEQLQPTMKALGQVADDQGSALHNLDASSKQLTTFFDQLGPFADASRPAFRSLGKRVEDRRSRRQGRAAGHLPARRLRRRHAGARQEPLDRPAAPRRPQARRREGPAQPRRPGLHRPRGAAAVRLRPDDLDVDLRPEQPHPQDRRLRRAVRRLRQRGDAQEEPGPRAPSAARASGPIQPGLNYPDVDQARTPEEAKRPRGEPSAPTATTTCRCPPSRRPSTRPRPRRPRPRDASTPSLPSVPTPSTPTVPTPTVPGVPPVTLPPLPGIGGTGGNDRGGSSPAAAAAAQAQREDEQRPAGPDQAPRLPAEAMSARAAADPTPRSSPTPCSSGR